MKSICRTLAFGIAALSVSTAVFAADVIKTVYHISDGEDQASRALINIRFHLEADPTVKIVVVALGDGIRFLLEGAKSSSGQTFAGAVGNLANQGVEFRVCNNTLVGLNIDPSKLLLETSVVPSGVAEVARLQSREGFAYIRP